MATGNFSGDGQKNTLEQLLCTANLTAELHGHFTFISILNAFLSIAASLGNALILVALRKESSLHAPSKVLLSNVATTDLCVGLIVEPLAVTLVVTAVSEHWNICRYVYEVVSVISFILFSVSVDTDCNKCGQTSRPFVGS